MGNGNAGGRTRGKIKNYYMKINYNAFSPKSGIWEIYVNNDVVTKWIFNQTENPVEQKEIAFKLTLNYLFEQAKQSYQIKKDDNFIMEVTYDKEIGYIKSLALLRNPNSKKNAPTDRTYKYEIIEFKIN